MKKLFLSLCLTLIVVSSAFGFVACKKDSEHPSKYVGTYLYDSIYIARYGSFVDTTLSDTISEVFTPQGYITLNKDGSVKTNLFENVAKYYEKELGYLPSYYYDYKWIVEDDKLFFTGFGEFYDQTGKVVNDIVNYVSIASLVQFYQLDENLLSGSGYTSSLVYYIKFKKA